MTVCVVWQGRGVHTTEDRTAEVLRVTKTLIVVGWIGGAERRFRRRDGFAAGTWDTYLCWRIPEAELARIAAALEEKP